MLALSAAALALGLVPLYGAFVAGIAVRRRSDRGQRGAGESAAGPGRNALAGISFGFFIPIYFAIIGLQLDLIHHFDVLFFIGFLAFACVAKASSVYLGARLSKENRFMSASLAIAMNARGGPGIVLASTAYATGIINQTFFVSLVMLSIVTSLLPARGWSTSGSGWALRRGSARPPSRKSPPGTGPATAPIRPRSWRGPAAERSGGGAVRLGGPQQHLDQPRRGGRIRRLAVGHREYMPARAADGDGADTRMTG